MATWLAGDPSAALRIGGHRAETDFYAHPRLQERYGTSHNAAERILSLGHELKDLPSGDRIHLESSILLPVKFNVTRCTFPKTEALSEWRAVRPPRPARSARHRHLRAPRRLSTRCAALWHCAAFNATPPSTTCTARELGDFPQRMGSSMAELDDPAR